MKKYPLPFLVIIAVMTLIFTVDVFAADLYLNQPLGSGVYATENGGIIAQSNCEINAGADVVLIADHFSLLPGFHVLFGSKLAIMYADYDGMDDTWEVVNFGNLGEDWNNDPDEDGLNNLAEFQNQTDPLVPDTDNDGMPDVWEIANCLNPVSDDASGDLDGDGFSNYGEFLIVTDPNDMNNVPAPGYYYQYDVLERIEKEIYVTSTRIQFIIEYEFDSVGNRTSRKIR